MSQKLDTSPAVIGIDIGKNSFHIVGQNQRGAIVLRRSGKVQTEQMFPVCASKQTQGVCEYTP